MKYSLRSLMIVVTLICVACFLLPRLYPSPWGTLVLWTQEQYTVFFIIGVVMATGAVLALARSFRHEQP